MTTRTLGLWALVALGLVGFVVWDSWYQQKKDEKKKESARLVTWSPGDITRVTLWRDKQMIELARQDGQWVLKQPVQETADVSAVDDWMGKVTQLSYEEKVGQMSDPDAATIFGFEGDSVARLVLFKGEDKMEFVRGHVRNYQGKSYVYQVGKDPVYLMNWDADFVFDKSALDFRIRKPFPEDWSKVQAIEWQTPEGTFEIRKESDQWKVSRGQWLWPLDKARVERAFEPLKENMILEFQSETDPKPAQAKNWGLDKPRIVVTLKLEGNQKEEYRLGSGTDMEYFVWLVSRHKVGRISQADFRKFENLHWKNLSDLTAPFRVPMDQVKQATLWVGDRWISVEKGEKGWRLSGQSNPQDAIEMNQVESLINRILGLAVEEFPETVQKAPTVVWKAPSELVIEIKNAQQKVLGRWEFKSVVKDLTNREGIKKNLVPVKVGHFNNQGVWIHETDFQKLPWKEVFKSSKSSDSTSDSSEKDSVKGDHGASSSP